MPNKAKKQKNPSTSSGRAKKKNKIKRSDLLPESREFLMEKELEKEQKRKILETSRLLKEKERQAEPQIDYEGDSHKRLAMWTGVIFFMVLIFFIWVYNIKATFRQTIDKSGKEEINLNQFTDDFKKTFDKIKSNFSEIKENLKATSTKPAIKEEEIAELKNKLEAMGDKIGTSTEEIATSSVRNE